MLHLTEHPPLAIDPDHANHVNQCINLRLLAERAMVRRPGRAAGLILSFAL